MSILPHLRISCYTKFGIGEIFSWEVSLRVGPRTCTITTLKQQLETGICDFKERDAEKGNCKRKNRAHVCEGKYFAPSGTHSDWHCSSGHAYYLALWRLSVVPVRICANT